MDRRRNRNKTKCVDSDDTLVKGLMYNIVYAPSQSSSATEDEFCAAIRNYFKSRQADFSIQVHGYRNLTVRVFVYYLQ
jgi:hypothetical protein